MPRRRRLHLRGSRRAGRRCRRRCAHRSARLSRRWRLDRGSTELRRGHRSEDEQARRGRGGRKATGACGFGEGAVWVANLDDSTLSRINPKTREVERTIPMQGVSPSDIAAGEGGVWVANGPDNAVVRVSPDANEVVDTIGTNRCSGYDASDRGRRRSCLVRLQQSASPRSIREATGRTRLRYLGLAPRGITVGLGAVWVSNADNTVSRINPRTQPGHGHAHRRRRSEGPRCRLRGGLGERFRGRRGLARCSCTGGRFTHQDPRASTSATDPSTSLSAPVESGSPTVATAPSRGSIRKSNKVIATIRRREQPSRHRGRSGQRSGSRVQAREPGGLRG